MFSNDEEEIDGEFVDNLLSRINSGIAGYVDPDDIKDSYFFLVNEGRRSDADALLNWGLQRQPDNVKLLLVRVTQHIDNDEREQAKHLLNYLSETAQDSPSFHFDLAILALRDGDLPNAMKGFEKSFSLATDDEVNLFIMDAAADLCRCEYYEEALTFYARLTPNDIFSDAQLAFEYAYALDKSNRDDEAIRAYEEVVKLDPFCANAWNNLGIEYGKKDRLAESLEAYISSSDANPYNQSPYFNKGNTLKALERYYEAIESYTEYVSLVALYSVEKTLDDVDSVVFMHIGECWQALGNYEMAKRFLCLTVNVYQPDSDNAWFRLGRCLVEKGENNAGRQAFEMAISIYGECPEYYYSNAQAHLNLGDVSGCIRMLEFGLSKSPNDVLAWFEVIRMKLMNMNVGAARSVSDYIAEMKQKYNSPTALRLVEAYIDYFVYGKKRAATTKLRMVAGETPGVICEASIEPMLSKLFEQKEVVPILKEFNIRLQ